MRTKERTNEPPFFLFSLALQLRLIARIDRRPHLTSTVVLSPSLQMTKGDLARRCCNGVGSGCSWRKFGSSDAFIARTPNDVPAKDDSCLLFFPANDRSAAATQRAIPFLASLSDGIWACIIRAKLADAEEIRDSARWVHFHGSGRPQCIGPTAVNGRVIFSTRSALRFFAEMI